MNASTLTPIRTLGPLTTDQRAIVMEHAPSLSVEGRRMFRRLLILAQERGLSAAVIARSAQQAREHTV